MEDPHFFSTKAHSSPKDLSPLLRIHPFSLSPRSKVTPDLNHPHHSPSHTHRPTIATQIKNDEGPRTGASQYKALRESNNSTAVSPQRCRRISLRMKLIPLYKPENDYLRSPIDSQKPRGRLFRYFRRRHETESHPGHPSVLLSADIPIPAAAFSLEAVLSPAFRSRFQ